MAHYAFLDENNIVTQVIMGKDEDELLNGLTPEEWYSAFQGQNCIRTSINAASNGFRKNYAGIGYYFDEARDAFIPPKPYESWILNEETCQWEAPTAMPTEDGNWMWVEEDLNWQNFTV
jgi:hypothetical protein